MVEFKKFKYIVFLIIPFIFADCAMFYSIFRKNSDFYSSKEQKILSKTTKSINYDYGYDPDMDLDYIFSFSYSDLNKRKNERDFVKTVREFDGKALLSYYEKIVGLKVKTEFKMELYKEKEKWNDYTYIKKYYMPPLDNYLEMLENQVKIINTDYAKKINDRKNVIKDEVVDDLVNKDMEEYWQERFYYLDY